MTGSPSPTSRRPSRACKRETWACNWRGRRPDGAVLPSCVLVDAGDRQHEVSMVPFQSAQRRALYQLSELGVPWVRRRGAALRVPLEVRRRRRRDRPSQRRDHARPRRGRPGEPRADPGHARRALPDAARAHPPRARPLRVAQARGRRRRPPRRVPATLFGDERIDYAAALDNHYARLDDGAWRDAHASFYASAHPWEDFAESWAQLMHVHDVVETGAEWGVVTAPRGPLGRRGLAGDVDHGERGRQRAGPLDGHARPVPVRPDGRRPGQGRVLLAPAPRTGRLRPLS